MKKVLFLDRDGVICRAMPRGEYLTSLDQWELMPGIVELLEAARQAGYLAVVVTNQSAVNRGLLKTETLTEIHDYMKNQLRDPFTAIYQCPHVDQDMCECRKPKPGMMLQAAQDLGVNLAESLIVGDSHKDVLAGRAAGVGLTVFLRNEHNEHERERCEPHHTVDDLREVIPFLS